MLRPCSDDTQANRATHRESSGSHEHTIYAQSRRDRIVGDPARAQRVRAQQSFRSLVEVGVVQEAWHGWIRHVLAYAEQAQGRAADEHALGEGALDERDTILADERFAIDLIHALDHAALHVVVDVAEAIRRDGDMPAAAVAGSELLNRRPVQGVGKVLVDG